MTSGHVIFQSSDEEQHGSPVEAPDQGPRKTARNKGSVGTSPTLNELGAKPMGVNWRNNAQYIREWCNMRGTISATSY